MEVTTVASTSDDSTMLLQVSQSPKSESEIEDVSGKRWHQVVKKLGIALCLVALAVEGTAYCRNQPVTSTLSSAKDFLGLNDEPNSCYIKDGETCPMSAMAQGSNQYTAVYPGGETACLDSSSEFFFQVFPGDSDKLVIFFQMGGACFDETTTAGKVTGSMFPQGLCQQSVSKQGARGILNKDNEKSPWKKHTIIHINYCSGDGHVGHKTNSYNGTEYKQHGYLNARAAVDWVKAQMDKTLESFVVSGSSAGAIATHLWANTLLTEFSTDGWSYKNSGVLVDSFAAVVPPGFLPMVLKAFGTCDIDVFKEACKGDKVTINAVFNAAMEAHSSTAFGIINSKTDSTQKIYYQAAAVALKDWTGTRISSAQYYRKVNLILNDYRKKPNFVAYIVEGEQHVFLPMEYSYKPDWGICNFYDVSVEGPNKGSPGVPMLYEWTKVFADRSVASTISNACFGQLLEQTAWDNGDYNNVSYCFSKLMVKDRSLILQGEGSE